MTDSADQTRLPSEAHTPAAQLLASQARDGQLPRVRTVGGGRCRINGVFGRPEICFVRALIVSLLVNWSVDFAPIRLKSSLNCLPLNKLNAKKGG